jgi:SAM-dependent methyltransferase
VIQQRQNPFAALFEVLMSPSARRGYRQRPNDNDYLEPVSPSPGGQDLSRTVQLRRYVRAMTPPFLRPAIRRVSDSAVRALNRLTDPSRKRYWDTRALEIDAKWNLAHADYPVIRECIKAIGATSIIDVGCGAGRMFPLYVEMELDFVGCDISEVALEIAHARFPNAKLNRLKSEDICLRALQRRFDLAISNWSLMCVDHRRIARAVAGIAQVAKAIYINEPIDEQVTRIADHLFLHDYDTMFSRVGFYKAKAFSAPGERHPWALYLMA